MRDEIRRPLLAAGLLLLVFLAAGLLGGPTSETDRSIILDLAAVRHAHPAVETAAIALTWAGSAYATLGAILLLALWKLVKGDRPTAAWLAVTVGGGRLLAEAIKLIVDRPRPHFEAWPVPVSSVSFPSGHATNSILAFTALALVLAPPSRRRAAILAAVVASLLVGVTRPFLGVHWPSDVIAGWCLGGVILLVSAPWRPERSAA